MKKKKYKRKDRKIKNGVCPSLLPEYHSGKGVKKKTRREKLCGGLKKKVKRREKKGKK